MGFVEFNHLLKRVLADNITVKDKKWLTGTINELIPLWEKKIGKTLEKTYVPKEQLLENIQGKCEQI